ncbi:MAG: hypothetical protein HUU29_04590 [Planctomycetaceae bacterium]|nr:hypothetical protein [Planctomycetaceae bacterium]
MATGQKTYWHLLSQRRAPSDYEVVTSRLLYYPGKEPEVHTPVGAWMGKHRSTIPPETWERFNDPRQTTYRSYTELQSRLEAHIDEVIRADVCGPVSRDTLALLKAYVAPLRYPCHGLMMLAAYAGHLAPSGKVAICLAFQATDELRRIDRITQHAVKRLGADAVRASRLHWQEAKEWQPLRKVIERLLVTYTWDESFIALNLVLKPLIDRVFCDRLGSTLDACGDGTFQQIFRSLADDTRWHREWSAAAVGTAFGPGETDAVQSVVDRWLPSVQHAVEVLAAFASNDAAASDMSEYAVFIEGMGLNAGKGNASKT